MPFCVCVCGVYMWFVCVVCICGLCVWVYLCVCFCVCMCVGGCVCFVCVCVCLPVSRAPTCISWWLLCSKDSRISQWEDYTTPAGDVGRLFNRKVFSEVLAAQTGGYSSKKKAKCWPKIPSFSAQCKLLLHSIFAEVLQLATGESTGMRWNGLNPKCFNGPVFFFSRKLPKIAFLVFNQPPQRRVFNSAAGCVTCMFLHLWCIRQFWAPNVICNVNSNATQPR